MLTLYLTSVADSHDSSVLDALLCRIAHGDRQALEEFYAHTRVAAYAYALSVLKNEQDAQDALHDSYLLIVKNASAYTSQGKPMAWVFTIIRNQCLQQIRSRRKFADFEQATDMSLEFSDVTNAENRMVLTACMECLSDEERQIVVLHAVAGFRHREIAKMLHILPSTVMSKYQRSLKKLKAVLQKE